MPVHRQTDVCRACRTRLTVSTEYATSVRTKTLFSLPCPACGASVAIQVPYATGAATPQILSYARTRPV